MRQFCADNTDVSEKVRLLGFPPPIVDVALFVWQERGSFFSPNIARNIEI